VASRFLNAGTNIRLLAKIERAAGYLIAAFGVFCFLMWWTGRAEDRHGMVFALMAGAFFLPLGMLLALAGLTLPVNGRSRWLLQLPALAWPLIFAALFRWLLVP
jgi:hypothetical protein